MNRIKIVHKTFDYLLGVVAERQLHSKSFKEVKQALGGIKGITQMPNPDLACTYFQHVPDSYANAPKYTIRVEAQGSCSLDPSNNPVKIEVQYYAKHPIKNTKIHHFSATQNLDDIFSLARVNGHGLDLITDMFMVLGLKYEAKSNHLAEMAGEFCLSKDAKEPGRPASVVALMREIPAFSHKLCTDWSLEIEARVIPIYEKPAAAKKTATQYYGMPALSQAAVARP